jgi:hypothetical protein
MAVASSWTGKAARFTRSNRHNAQDFPINGVSRVGETPARGSKRRMTTQASDRPRPLFRLLPPVKLGRRAIGYHIGNARLIRDIWLLRQGTFY